MTKTTLKTGNGERIAIVAGLRTPFAKQATAFHGVPAVDLGKMVVNELMQKHDVDPAIVDQLVYGQVVQMPEAPNIAREIVLGTGMNVHTDAYSVSRACATSFQSTVNVAESIMAGIVDVGKLMLKASESIFSTLLFSVSSLSSKSNSNYSSSA